MDTLPLDTVNCILASLSYRDIDKLSTSNHWWKDITHESFTRHRASIIISNFWRQYCPKDMYESDDYEEEYDPFQCECGCGLDPTECAISYLKYEQRYMYR